LFIVDDLVAIALFALMGKLAHDVITEKPSYDDEDPIFSTYSSSDFIHSLNRTGAGTDVYAPRFSSLPTPSQRRRPHSFVFDSETGEFWEE